MNWTEFFAMGGYAKFVWPSFGLTLAALAIHVVLPLRRRRRELARIRAATEQAQ